MSCKVQGTTCYILKINIAINHPPACGSTFTAGIYPTLDSEQTPEHESAITSETACCCCAYVLSYVQTPSVLIWPNLSMISFPSTPLWNSQNMPVVLRLWLDLLESSIPAARSISLCMPLSLLWPTDIISNQASPSFNGFLTQ